MYAQMLLVGVFLIFLPHVGVVMVSVAVSVPCSLLI
jgi:hypothetical protein